jgi:serine/threonine protein kinase
MKLCLTCNFQTAGDQDVCPRDGSSMVTVGDDPLLGVVVEGRYKIESVIGQGSAGTVYKAIQELIGREVAIKVLHDYLVSDQEFIKRFTQEAKASSRLSHPNIITIYDFGVIPQGGRPYIAMDLLKGTPLSDYIAEQGHIPVEEALPLFKQVCGALAEAHRQGVVHRDIKPENIVLVERSGQRLFPIVVDFGIARLVQEESDVARITRTGTVCGSPTYMSPEQCMSSKVDNRSDIYSLGIVIYETLTGEVPFLSDELVKVMAMHLSDNPKPLNAVREDLHFSDAVERLVGKTLEKDPAARYQTMEELAAALDEAAKPPEQIIIQPSSHRKVDIAPGPLANDDDLAPKRVKQPAAPPTVVPQSAPQEAAVAARSKSMDLASMALEELRTSGAYDEVDHEVMAKMAAAARMPQDPQVMSQQLSASNFQKGRVGGGGFGSALRNLHPRVVFLIMFATVLITGGVVCAIQPQLVGLATNQITAMINQSGASTGFSDGVPVLLAKADKAKKEGKLEEAFKLYKHVKEKSSLPKEKVNDYANVCLSLAKQYGRVKRYDDAMTVLQQAPSGSSQSDQIKQLINRYKDR